MTNSIKIFSGSSNPSLTKGICDYLKIQESAIQISRFADGEISIKILENIRGSDVFIIQATSYPTNEHIMELLLIIDAFKRASAKRITVVMPYYGYSRQDRKVEPRVPISAKVVAKIIQNIGADRILCMDLHADPIQGFFDIPVDHLFAAPIIVDYLKKIKLPNAMIISPDTGGAERARFFAKQLNIEMGIIDKRREKANQSEVMNIVGDVKNKDCILLDDMIDTGGTICKAAQALINEGANSVRAGATHGVFSNQALQRLQESCIEEVLITDTISIPEEKRIPKLKVLSVASLIGEAVQRIHDEKSISSLFL